MKRAGDAHETLPYWLTQPPPPVCTCRMGIHPAAIAAKWVGQRAGSTLATLVRLLKVWVPYIRKRPLTTVSLSMEDREHADFSRGSIAPRPNRVKVAWALTWQLPRAVWLYWLARAGL